MHSRLLEYTPDIDSLMPLPAVAAARSGELEAAAGLLEHLEAGAAEAWLVGLIDGALGPRRGPQRPVRLALARLLGLAARRVLRSRHAGHVAAVGRLFSLELEGLSAEDQLFELARQFVRFARTSARHAALAADPDSPRALALKAAWAAARAQAPGLAPLLADLARGRELAVLDSVRPQRLPAAGFRSLEGA